MGIDWRAISLSGYLEALEAHNEAHDPKADKSVGEPETDLNRLRRFMKARASDSE